MINNNLIHKAGEVLEINIENVITSCLVIQDTGNYNVGFWDKILFIIDHVHDDWYPDPKNLLKIVHTIDTWEEDGGKMNPCCQLLIGDQKVWMSYNKNEESESDKAWKGAVNKIDSPSKI